MLRISLFLLSFIISTITTIGQIDYTANDKIVEYDGTFLLGANMGYHPGWQDEQLADICAGNPALNVEGIGIETLRPALFEHFLEYWGYDARVKTFEHYKNLGLKDLTVFVGFPSKEHRETEEYCPGQPSEHFKNLYEPIWDGGANGTPVNDNNYYALYLYKMVTRYKDNVKFWEIWNEPDFDYIGNSEQPKNKSASWWNVNPEVCEYKMKAPIQHYIRTLRISYEVIKSLSPDSYVTLGGLGYPSFADGICRQTDNPVDGSVTPEYPLKGGAYFDVVSFHSYPHIDGSLRDWDNSIVGFRHKRHSDEAVKGMLKKFQEFKITMYEHGYDGVKYPEKLFIITECNLPRIEVGDFVGGDEVQRNFNFKAIIECHKNDILQYHCYNLGESASYDNTTEEFKMMGLFQQLENVPPYTQKVNESGIAYKTISMLIGKAKFESKKTLNLDLPSAANGAVFTTPEGEEVICVWSKTTKDRSESSFKSYALPSSFKMKKLEVFKWDFAKTGKTSIMNAESIELTGSPIFLKKLKKIREGEPE